MKEYPLYTELRAHLCPSARYVGGVSRWLCECVQPDNCLGAHPPLIFDSLPAEDHDSMTDRYTVLPYPEGIKPAQYHAYLGCSMGGRAFSQWGEIKDSDIKGSLDNLGRRVAIEDLDDDTRRHIVSRLKEDF